MKLSSAIFGAFIGSAKANQYEVTGCNNADTNVPELSIRISEDYFNANVGTDDSFAFADGFYTKTIPQELLGVSFPDDDNLALTYSLSLLNQESIALNDNQSMVFNTGGSINFECTYARYISISTSINVDSPPDSLTATGVGGLSYDMTVDMGELGGNTSVSITPNHSLSVYPRLLECNIQSGDFVVYPVHSFPDDQGAIATCFDQSRLNFQQLITATSLDINFEMRSFRFNDPTVAQTDAQEQVFTCSLYIDSENTFDPSTNEDCSCYTEEECATPSVPEGFNVAGAGLAEGVGYAETTLSTGKRLLLKFENGPYQNAVDFCTSIGAEVLLTETLEENNETGTFITDNRDSLASEKVVWLRAKNPSGSGSAEDLSGWIDPNTGEALVYHNLVQYYYQPAALLQEASGYRHWKGTTESNIDPSFMCELPAV